jgi:HSP20 family protein
MQTIEQAYKEICRLHEQLAQAPAPEIGPQSFVPFPPGVDPIAFAVEEVSQLKQMFESVQAAKQQQMQQVAWIPRASVFTSDSNVLFQVEIPGVAKEELSVTIAGGELVVRGQRRQPCGDSTMRPVVVEQAWGTFERRFPAPPWCNPDKVHAKYAHGVLEISLSRQEEGNVGEFRVEIA